VEAGVVFTVSMAVPLPPAARFMLTGFRLHVGGLCAAAGEALREQVRFIVPEYVLPAIRATFAVALDPGETGERGSADITNGATVTTVVALAVA
jgi:sulfite reductase beta subunit-like hemoprotein